MSQEEFATAGGVKRRAQAHYKSGERSPDATYLAAIGAAGADVLYVLTGNRTPVAVITPEEKALLDNYNHAGAEGQAAARKILDALAQPNEQGKKVGQRWRDLDLWGSRHHFVEEGPRCHLVFSGAADQLDLTHGRTGT